MNETAIKTNKLFFKTIPPHWYLFQSLFNGCTLLEDVVNHLHHQIRIVLSVIVPAANSSSNPGITSVIGEDSNNMQEILKIWTKIILNPGWENSLLSFQRIEKSRVTSSYFESSQKFLFHWLLLIFVVTLSSLHGLSEIWNIHNCRTYTRL